MLGFDKEVCSQIDYWKWPTIKNERNDLKILGERTNTSCKRVAEMCLKK